MSAKIENNHSDTSQISVPPGTIIQWHGELGGIPKGWRLCDGTQGTPDLRSRFQFPHEASTRGDESGKAILFLKLASTDQSFTEEHSRRSEEESQPAALHVHHPDNQLATQAPQLASFPESPQTEEASLVDVPTATNRLTNSATGIDLLREGKEIEVFTKLISQSWNLSSRSRQQESTNSNRSEESILNLTAIGLKQVELELNSEAEGLDSEWKFQEIANGIFAIQNVLRGIQFPSTSYLSVDVEDEFPRLTDDPESLASHWLVLPTADSEFRLASLNKLESARPPALHCQMINSTNRIVFCELSSAATWKIAPPPDFYD